MPTTYDLQFGGERLVLHADRTLWWPRRRTLFATDLHAGKTEHLRRYGLAIPGGSLAADLQRLQMAAERYDAARLLFLGDLFHSEVNAEWEPFAAWCRSRPYTIGLVRGNHDRFLSEALLQAAAITVFTEPYQLDGFSLRHHPAEPATEPAYILAGHVHPVYWSHGPARDRLRLPCFWLQPRQLILPAFGSFTGGYAINRLPALQVLACTPDGHAIYDVSKPRRA